ncbi:MAG: hypothetical protein KAT65_09100, partial [Methanophagales archaeon]|nr:hypothetical protein [Methanophagales archaeon]
QLYIAKSLDLKAAEGESPEIRAPEVLEDYVFDFEMFPGFVKPLSATPVIMVNGTSGDVSVDITGFVINGISVTPENSEYGICGIAYLYADGSIEDNEVKNIWGLPAEQGESPYAIMNSIGIFAFSRSDVTVPGVIIHKNSIHDYTGVESYGIGIFGSGGKATVTENTVTGARSLEFPDQIGIYIYNAIATVNDNIVSDHIYTESIAGWYASGICVMDTNLTAEGNTLIGGGIWVTPGYGHPHSTAVIKNNTVDASGVYEEGCGPMAGIALITFPPFMPYPYEGEPSLTATVEGNRFIGGPGSGIIVGGVPEVLAGWGFEPVGTVDATITRNNISGWEHGIKLLNCSNSTVYLNDFVNNTQSVFVNESTNVYSSPE